MTLNPDTQINPRTTVADLEALFDGQEHNSALPDGRDHWECDMCSTGVAYASTARATMYLCDDILGDGPQARQIRADRPLIPMASLCEDCGTRQLLFPCEGFAEVHVQFDLGADRHYANVAVTDVSPRDDGIPWDPEDLSEQITGVPFGDNQLFAAADSGVTHWGPEDMVRVFLSMGAEIDIRELVRWNGELDGEKLDQAKGRYRKFQRKMRRSGHSRRAFRDHVRGDDQ